LKKIKWDQHKLKCAVCGTGVVLLTAILALSVHFTSAGSLDGRLEAKIKEYSQNYGITEKEIKNDKTLMEQFKMEVAQELKIDKLTKDISVTKEEIENYRKMLGTSMDVKKSLFVLFNTFDECKAFIEKAGSVKKLSDITNGTLPMMDKDENGIEYFNVVGNEALETVFDSLKDSEYTKEPFEFSGMYCYMKRLKVDSPVSSDEKIIELIKSEKAQELLQKENKNGGN